MRICGKHTGEPGRRAGTRKQAKGRRKLRRIGGIAAAFIMLFGCAGLAEDEDPVVVRVNSVTYPLSVVSFALNPYWDLAEVNGEELTSEEIRETAEQVIGHFISLGVIENKLMETGNNDFTEDEMDILRAEAASQFEQTWQRIYQDTLSYDSSVTEEEVSSWMTVNGYTQEAFLRELMVNERENRILDLYCSDVSVTEEEVQAYYQETFLGPDTEKYRENVPLYEEEILLTDSEAFYIPEGYRYIKNILLPFPEGIAQELNALQVQGKKLVKKAQAAYDKLAEAAAAGEDIAPLKEKYDHIMERISSLEEKYREKEREAIPLLKEQTDLIREQFDAGIRIETLLKKYSMDQQQTGTDKPGALYHPDSVLWPEDARKVIDRMTAPGQLSEPYADEEGVHLIYYAGDAPGGERQLTEEQQEQLKASALYHAQTERLEQLIETWKEDDQISTDLSYLDLPEPDEF